MRRRREGRLSVHTAVGPYDLLMGATFPPARVSRRGRCGPYVSYADAEAEAKAEASGFNAAGFMMRLVRLELSFARMSRPVYIGA